jgi:prepilin-type N-terminal cleavage/methylation domain-containing protein
MDPRSRRERRDERGFTLIELMIVVAIVAILAAVVVPMFVSESKKVSAKSEVTAMFAEIGAKQDRYKNENGVYLELTCNHSTLTNAAQAVPCTTDSNFLALGIIPPHSKIRCSYTVVVGDKADDPTAAFQPDGITTLSVPTTNPAVGWYVIRAKCNMDNTGSSAPADFSYYVTSSLDQTLQVANEGK